jgi:hypothetical protein
MFVYIKENEMKKVALSLLALALVGSMAFGQDAPVVKLSGYVDSGLKFVKIDTKDGVFSSYANDYDAAGTWGKVTAAVTGANYGATATVKASDQATITWQDGSTTTAPWALIDTAKAWFSPMEGLTGFVGTGYNDAFDGVDAESPDNFFPNKGYALTFGASGFVAGAQIGPKNGASVIGVGAAYAMDKVASVRFSGNTTTDSKFDAYAVSGSVSAIENLSLSAGYFATAVATSAVNALDVSASYAITPELKAGVDAYDFLTKEYFTVKPNASYVVAPGVTVSAYYKLYTEGKNKVTNSADNEIQGKVALALGGGTLGVWAQYNTKKESVEKIMTIQTDYVISF